MKPTNQLRALVRQSTILYAERLSIKTPHVVFTRVGMTALPKRFETYDIRKSYSVCYPREGVIFINLARHKTLDQLLESIVHEMIHMRFPTLKHGRKFENTATRMFLGATYKPYTGKNTEWFAHHGRVTV